MRMTRCCCVVQNRASRPDHGGMPQQPDRSSLLPRPDRSMMPATLQPPPVPPAGLAMERPRQPSMVSETTFFHVSSCIITF